MPVENLLPPIRRACLTNTFGTARWAGLCAYNPFFRLFVSRSRPLKKSQVGLAESSDIWKYPGKIGIRYTKPGGEGSAVLVYRHRWYPAAPRIASLVGIIRTVSRERRKNGSVRTWHAVELTSEHGSAHNELVRAPRMVGSEVPIWHPGARKVGQRKSRYLRSYSELHRGVVKRLHGVTHLQ